MTKTLAQYFNLHRRYSRSINLERDLESADLLEGYILTQRAKDALQRIWTSFTTTERQSLQRGEPPQRAASSNRAWTLTSVYGTQENRLLLII